MDQTCRFSSFSQKLSPQIMFLENFMLPIFVLLQLQAIKTLQVRLYSNIRPAEGHVQKSTSLLRWSRLIAHQVINEVRKKLLQRYSWSLFIAPLQLMACSEPSLNIRSRNLKDRQYDKPANRSFSIPTGKYLLCQSLEIRKQKLETPLS